MNQAFLGLILLFGIIGLRWAAGFWRMQSVKRHFTAGQQAITENRLGDAEREFRVCVKRLPMSAQFRRVLGGILARNGNLKEAEEQLRMGAELEPRNPGGHLDLGFFFAVHVPERADAALDAIANALSCEPKLREKLATQPALQHLRSHRRFAELFPTQE